MVEYCELAPDLKISRILTGLWQIADMEKEGIILEHEKFYNPKWGYKLLNNKLAYSKRPLISDG